MGEAGTLLYKLTGEGPGPFMQMVAEICAQLQLDDLRTRPAAAIKEAKKDLDPNPNPDTTPVEDEDFLHLQPNDLQQQISAATADPSTSASRPASSSSGGVVLPRHI